MLYGMPYGIMSPGAKYPEIKAMSSGHVGWSSTSIYTPGLPAGIEPGDLLVMLITYRDGSFQFPAGWTPFASGYGFAALKRIATGSDGGTYQSKDAGFWGHVCYRISGADGDVAAAVSSTFSVPHLTPPWGQTKTMWLAVAASVSSDLEGVPGGYTADAVVSFNGNRIIATSRFREAASESGGAFSGGPQQASVARIAIKPALAG